MLSFNRNDIGTMREITSKEALNKAGVLQDKLRELGLEPMKSYNCVDGRNQRNKNLVDKSGNPLDPNSTMIGTVLKTPTNSESCK